MLLFGERVAPYWAIAAREYLERWVHQLQIRRALGLGNGRLDAPPLRTRARRDRPRPGRRPTGRRRYGRRVQHLLPGRPGARTRAVPDGGKRRLTREDVHAVGTPSSMDGKILRTLGWILDIAVVLGAVAAGTAIADLMLHV